MRRNIVYYSLIFLEILGIANAGYLTYEHYSRINPPCNINISFVNCQRVLQSSYSLLLGAPISLYGLLYLLILFALTFIALYNDSKIWKQLIIILDTIGALVSVYLMFLQLFIIKSLCLYCTFSALICFIIFFITLGKFKKEWREMLVYLNKLINRILKI